LFFLFINADDIQKEIRMKLIFATNNQHKLIEIQQLIGKNIKYTVLMNPDIKGQFLKIMIHWKKTLLRRHGIFIFN